MDVEFEEVEELVCDEVDGTVDFLFDAEEQFEGSPSFVAGWEGDVLELSRGVGYVFACFATRRSAGQLIRGERKDVHCAIQTADGNWLARVVASCFLERLQRLLTAQRTGEGGPEGTERQ